MSDRTYGLVRILACPPEQAATVIEALNDHFHDISEIVLGESYDDDEVTCGTARELANDLSALEGVAFVVSEDPKYEWLGEVQAKLPDGTRFACEIGPDGQHVLNLASWRQLRQRDDAELRAAVDEALCLHGDAALQALIKELEAIPAKERTVVLTEEEA